MNLLCLILLVSAVMLWFAFAEYGSLFGVYYPTCAIRHRNYPPVIFVFIIIAIFFTRYSGVPDAMAELMQSAVINCRSALVLLLSSFITLLALRFFSIRASVAYALLGAVVAHMYYVADGYALEWGFILSFIAAPAVSFVIALILSILLKTIFSRLNLHLIKLAYYMRSVVVVCVILTAIALGFNWGGFLVGLGGSLEGETQSAALLVSIIGAAAVSVVMMLSNRAGAEKSSGIFSDFSIYAVLSVDLL